MNKTKLYFWLTSFLIVFTFEAYSQKCSIKGFVYNSESREPIEYANVRLSKTPMGSSTDADGAYFIISIDPGDYIIEVFRIGFDTTFQEVNISPGEMKILNFTIEEKAYQLNDLQISGNRSNYQREINISKIKASGLEIEKIPNLGSIPDITQYLQTLPGVVSNGDIGGQLYVRGGAPVHNKILLDGAIIYNPLHSIGLFSVFDVDIIRSLDVYTGGFGSQYGGSISSIMDITTRMGNINRFSGKVDVSTLGGKILVEGPIIKPGKQNKGHSSYLVSYKTSNFSQASRLFYPYLDSNFPFSFSDLFIKTSITTSNVFKANIFGFYSTDNVGVSESIAEFNWKSYGFGGSLIISPPNSASLLKAYFATSSYKLKLEEYNFLPRKSEIASFNMGLNVNFYYEENYLKYGVDIVTLNTDYFYYSTSLNSLFRIKLFIRTFRIYIVSWKYFKFHN